MILKGNLIHSADGELKEFRAGNSDIWVPKQADQKPDRALNKTRHLQFSTAVCAYF